MDDDKIRLLLAVKNPPPPLSSATVAALLTAVPAQPHSGAAAEPAPLRNLYKQ